MIELHRVTKSFSGKQAINNVDLFIQEGELFGIIGQSGAGKSTLLRCINLLERPDSGDVIVDGHSLLNLSALQLRQARHKIAMIFQHFNLINAKTVYDNIALPLRIQGVTEDEIATKVNEMLALVELTDKKKCLSQPIKWWTKATSCYRPSTYLFT